MQYVVYNKKTGEIVRTYRKILAESGETAFAEESEVFSDLPLDLTRDEVEAIAAPEFSFERGQTYRVDPNTQQMVGEEPRSGTRRASSACTPCSFQNACWIG